MTNKVAKTVALNLIVLEYQKMIVDKLFKSNMGIYDSQHKEIDFFNYDEKYLIYGELKKVFKNLGDEMGVLETELEAEIGLIMDLRITSE